MESSTVVAFRALVMLACLVLVPLAAIFGSAFPEVVRCTILEKMLPPKKNAATPGAASASEAPQFGRPSTEPTAWQSPAGQNRNGAPGPLVPGSPYQPGTSGVGNTPGNAAPFAPGNAAIETAGPGSIIPAKYSAPAEQASPAPPIGQESAAITQNAAPSFGTPPGQFSPDGRVASLNAPPTTIGTDPFTQIQKRLRECGATYYLLETWGNAGELYRFHCKTSIGGVAAVRHFEATEADALRAMSRVLEQVEAWRAGRAN